MKTILGLAIAASALAIGAPSMAATLLNGPCTLSVGTSCLFSGNINTQLSGNNSLGAADAAYNSQSPTPTTLLNLAGMANILDAPGINTNTTSGTYHSSFEVTYYAVKAGDFFQIFEVAPTETVNWSTAGISVGSGQTPDISHLLVFGPAGGVPEPATWAMMILGLTCVGGALRQHRRAAQVA